MTVGRIPNVEGGIQPTLLTTAGDIMYASSASNPDRLGIGTASQILAVNSGATAPEWVAAPSSGGMTLISTTTLSGVTTTLSSIPQTYNSLFIIISGVTGNTGNARIRCLPNNVNNLSNQSVVINAASASEVNTVTGFTFGTTLRTDANNAFILQINNYTSTTSYKPFTYYGFYVSASANNTITAGGAFRSNTEITSIVFDYGGTNTFASGTVLLYGVK